jgi:hypothetical protein
MKQQKKQEIIKRWLSKRIGEDLDKFDWLMESDWSLSLEEIKGLLMAKYNLKDPVTKAQIIYEQEQQLEETERINNKLIETFKQTQKETFRATKPMQDYYAPVYKAIDKLKAGYTSLVFIKGSTGIGKSFNINVALSGAEFVEIAGDITPAYLYRLLFENNGKIIYFRDLSRIMSDMRCLELFKNAFDTTGSQRLITNYNYSKEQEDLPKSFLFNGKAIFDFNGECTKFSEDWQAFINRGIYVNLVFSFDEISNILLNVAKDDTEKQVTEFIINKYEFIGLAQLNLRTQQRAFNTYKYAAEKGLDWQDEVLKELRTNMSRIRTMLYQIMGNKPMASLDLKKYLLRTGQINSLRTADRKIQTWIELEEVYKIGDGERNFLISLKPIELGTMNISDINANIIKNEVTQ